MTVANASIVTISIASKAAISMVSNGGVVVMLLNDNNNKLSKKCIFVKKREANIMQNKYLSVDDNNSENASISKQSYHHDKRQTSDGI